MSRRRPARAVAAFAVLLSLGAGMASGSQPDMAPKGDGTKITIRGSEYGRMLWAPGRQAIYIFERDQPNKSRCYGECAKDWPPVLTKGKPRAGRGIDGELLRTTKRRNGDRQVTYAGKPLYTYAHEGRNDVFCHDVELNGGYWWALGMEGERLP